MNILAQTQQTLDKELDEMNALIRRYLHTSNPMMNEVVAHYLKTKGKQIRPLLVLLSARMFGGVTEHTIHAAAALEMLHNASLIHDDIVDETKLRRGMATLNAIWGNHVAVLVGDFFVSNALAAGIATGNIQIIRALSDLGTELSLGEIDQISNARDHRFEEKAYLGMINRKTASLFMNCVRIGAQTAGASDEELKGMDRYAELLGLCFQIKDDIFDYFPDSRIGKPTGNDLREDKVTLPLIYALHNAPASDAGKALELLKRGNLSEEEIQELLLFARENGGIDYAFARMRQMQDEADAIILTYPESEWRERFRSLFDFIISRDR